MEGMKVAMEERFERLAVRKTRQTPSAMCIDSAKAYSLRTSPSSSRRSGLSPLFEAFSSRWLSRTNARFGAS